MQNLKNSFAGFWKYRYLLQNLITRDFKLKYRRSVLGVAWSVLNPLLTCLVMWAVFGALFNQTRPGHRGFPAVPYHRPADVQLLPREHRHGHGKRAEKRPAAAQSVYS